MKNLILAVLTTLSLSAFAQTVPENFGFDATVPGNLFVSEMLNANYGENYPEGVFNTTILLTVESTGQHSITLTQANNTRFNLGWCINTRIGCDYFSVLSFAMMTVTDVNNNIVGEWNGYTWEGSLNAGESYTLFFTTYGKVTTPRTWIVIPDGRNFVNVAFQ